MTTVPVLSTSASASSTLPTISALSINSESSPCAQSTLVGVSQTEPCLFCPLPCVLKAEDNINTSVISAIEFAQTDSNKIVLRNLQSGILHSITRAIESVKNQALPLPSSSASRGLYVQTSPSATATTSPSSSTSSHSTNTTLVGHDGVTSPSPDSTQDNGFTHGKPSVPTTPTRDEKVFGTFGRMQNRLNIQKETRSAITSANRREESRRAHREESIRANEETRRTIKAARLKKDKIVAARKEAISDFETAVNSVNESVSLDVSRADFKTICREGHIAITNIASVPHQLSTVDPIQLDKLQRLLAIGGVSDCIDSIRRMLHGFVIAESKNQIRICMERCAKEGLDWFEFAGIRRTLSDKWYDIIGVSPATAYDRIHYARCCSRVGYPLLHLLPLHWKTIKLLMFQRTTDTTKGLMNLDELCIKAQSGLRRCCSERDPKVDYDVLIKSAIPHRVSDHALDPDTTPADAATPLTQSVAIPSVSSVASVSAATPSLSHGFANAHVRVANMDTTA